MALKLTMQRTIDKNLMKKVVRHKDLQIFQLQNFQPKKLLLIIKKYMLKNLIDFSLKLKLIIFARYNLNLIEITNK